MCMLRKKYKCLCNHFSWKSQSLGEGLAGTYVHTYHDDNNMLHAHNFACKYNVQNVDGQALHTLDVVRALCLGACGAHLYTLDLGEYMYTLCKVNELAEIQVKPQ